MIGSFIHKSVVNMKYSKELFTKKWLKGRSYVDREYDSFGTVST